eukprot:TRINITY_DN39579_c0_g1_i1.p1 TRINITY_DN39579_c0_g1~~TRINITY_DN39579_c0_g1_i1.p1  ORF type:complete len:186 (-),score=29.88 TRINITY_DN39579_c0_g1_i1:246-776(-)
MGNVSPTGRTPVVVKQLDGSSFEVLCNIGLQSGKDLADIVAKHASLAPDSFDLIFVGRKIQDKTNETLLNMGFTASGSFSVVRLIPRQQARGLVVSLTLEQLGIDRGLLSCVNMAGDDICAFEVDPERIHLKEVHDLVEERVGACNGKLHFVCGERILDVRQEGKMNIGALCISVN